jgi:concanavalin A-like lectin/glucanase superfamily protein
VRAIGQSVVSLGADEHRRQHKVHFLDGSFISAQQLFPLQLMKTLHPICLSFFLLGATEFVNAAPTTATSQAASATQSVPSPTPYAVTKQDGSSRVWEWMTYEKSPSGRIVPKKHSYTELATGLNYLKNGQWTASKEKIDVLPQGGAEAIQGQHQVYFPGNINTGVIKVVTPDGKPMESRPLAIFYDDGNNTVALAVLTNSIGVLVGSNEVVYPNAFSGLKADLRYTYKKVGFEQDIVLQQQPHPPEYYGLDPAKTRLQVLTEYIGTADPVQKASAVNQEDGLSDTTLTFGQMKMVPGKAFAVGNSNPARPQTGGVAVYKSWQHIAGRTFLVEELPVRKIAAQLEQLPLQASADTTASPANFILQKVSPTRLLPTTRLADADVKPVQLARANVNYNSGVVLDYVAEDNTTQTNFTFQGETTYLLDGEFDLWGTTTFEGGTVIKYDYNGYVIIEPGGTVNCETAPYLPVVFTSLNDNTVGESMSGSGDSYYTGTPSYADDYEVFFPETSVTLSNFRFSYANQIIFIWGSVANFTLRDCQFANVYNILINDSGCPFQFYNVLVDQVVNNYLITAYYSGNGTIENMTLDCPNGLSGLVTGSCSLALTNCLITKPDGGGGTYVSTNGTSWSDMSVPIYQTVGGGSYYLAAGSPYRDAGTTAIDPTLLTDIATKTTYPPLVYSNTTISVATTFSPQAQRDTDIPDLGYHYDPLDYVFGGTYVYSNITFSAGTAVGWFNGGYYPGIGIILESANASFNGTATAPCVFARNDMVQEGGNGNWTVESWLGGIVGYGGNYTLATAPTVDMQFTRCFERSAEGNFLRDAGDGTLQVVRATDSEFYLGGIGGYLMDLGFTNCLFVRSRIGTTCDCSPSIAMRNCTMWNGILFAEHWGGATWPVWIVNCAFDNTDLSDMDDYSGGNTNITYCDFNAFVTNAYRLPVLGAHDVIVAPGFNWQSSWLGNYYLPAGSPLIDAGNTTADQVGLYHFTTQVSQVPETNSIVDIGYHYVAVGPDTSGMVGYWPLDEGTGTVAHDESGYGDNGTLESSPAWTSGRIGPSALSFDGTSYVTVSDSTPLEVGGSGADFSVSYWLYLKAGYTGNWRNLMHKGNSDYDRTFGMWMLPSDNRMHFTIGTTANWNEYGFSTAQVPLNQWVHVAYVKAGNQLQLYLNGALDSAITLAGTSVNNNGPIYFGKDPWYQGVDCDLDDIRIYSRALSASDVASLAAGTLAPLDTNGDGIPDYLEDANGNGVVDTGEQSWLISPFNGLSTGNGLQVFTPLK